MEIRYEVPTASAWPSRSPTRAAGSTPACSRPTAAASTRAASASRSSARSPTSSASAPAPAGAATASASRRASDRPDAPGILGRRCSSSSSTSARRSSATTPPSPRTGSCRQILELAEPLQGKRVLHLSATAFGGGVAEILYTLVPLMRDAGLEAEWRIIHGEEEFFDVTKTIHNALQGDPTELTPEQRGDLPPISTS